MIPIVLHNANDNSNSMYYYDCALKISGKVYS